MQRAIKRERKQEMAHEIHKIADVMHTIIFAERPWRRKMHETAARSYFLKGAWGEKERTERAMERHGRTNVAKTALMKAVWGSEKRFFQCKMLEVDLQNHASHCSEKHIFEKNTKTKRM